MADPISSELELSAALRLTAEPPQAWIDAATEIPTTVGDLDALESRLQTEEFRRRFADDPRAAVSDAGLPPSEPVIAAVRDRLGQSG